MPYAVINYGAPSQYLQLSEDYQRLMSQQAQMNAARVDRRNQMWSQAVGGAFNNASNAIMRYADTKHREAREDAQQRHEEQVWDERQGRVIDWQVEQATGLPGRDALRQYTKDTGQSYADIVQEQQNEAVLSRARALNDEKIRANLREQALSPFVLDPQTQQSMKMLPPPIQQNFLENQAQREKVVSAYRSGEVSLPETMTMLKPIDENLNRVASMAQRMRQPTPDEELAQSYATKDGHSFVKNRNGWSQVKEDDSTEKPQNKSYVELSLPKIQEMFVKGDVEGAKAALKDAHDMDDAIHQSRVHRVADVDMYFPGGGKPPIKLDQVRGEFTKEIAQMAKELMTEMVDEVDTKGVPVKGEGGRPKRKPKYTREQAFEEARSFFQDAAGVSNGVVETIAPSKPQPKKRTKSMILDEAMQYPAGSPDRDRLMQEWEKAPE